MFSEIAEIALVTARLGQFLQFLKTCVILILNFTRPHAITHTNISDESSCDISGNESDTGLTIEVNEEKPIKNKKKATTTEEIKNFIEKNLFSSDDEKPIKNTITKKTKKVVKKSDSISSSGDDKDNKLKKQSNQKKLKRKLQPKTLPIKHLWKVMISKDFKKRQKNFVLNILIIPNEKIINML